jgi:hypothetical protein
MLLDVDPMGFANTYKERKVRWGFGLGGWSLHLLLVGCHAKGNCGYYLRSSASGSSVSSRTRFVDAFTVGVGTTANLDLGVKGANLSASGNVGYKRGPGTMQVPRSFAGADVSALLVLIFAIVATKSFSKPA